MPALERNAGREPHLRHRRRARLLERERGHEHPRRLAGERHAEHALRGVEVFAGAFQVQQQQAIADRIQRRRNEHAHQCDPRRAIEPPLRIAELQQHDAREDHAADAERRHRHLAPRIAIQQRRAQHARDHRELETARDQPRRPARRGVRQQQIERDEADRAARQPSHRMRAHRTPHGRDAALPRHQRQQQRQGDAGNAAHAIHAQCPPSFAARAVEHVGQGEEQRRQQRDADGRERAAPRRARAWVMRARRCVAAVRAESLADRVARPGERIEQRVDVRPAHATPTA